MPLLVWLETSGKLGERWDYFSMASFDGKWICFVKKAFGKGKSPFECRKERIVQMAVMPLSGYEDGSCISLTLESVYK